MKTCLPAASARLTLTLVLVLAGSLPLVAGFETSAAAPPPPRVGDRVRLTLLAGPPPTIGRLRSFDAQSLGLLLDGASGPDTTARLIPRASIAALELGRRRGHAGTGALLGAGVGLFVGIVIAGQMESQGEQSDGRKLSAVASGPFYGAALGAISGALLRQERWEPRPLPGGTDEP